MNVLRAAAHPSISSLMRYVLAIVLTVLGVQPAAALPGLSCDFEVVGNNYKYPLVIEKIDLNGKSAVLRNGLGNLPLSISKRTEKFEDPILRFLAQAPEASFLVFTHTRQNNSSFTVELDSVSPKGRMWGQFYEGSPNAFAQGWCYPFDRDT